MGCGHCVAPIATASIPSRARGQWDGSRASYNRLRDSGPFNPRHLAGPHRSHLNVDKAAVAMSSGGSRTWASFRSSFAQRSPFDLAFDDRSPDVRRRSHEPWLPSEPGFFRLTDPLQPRHVVFVVPSKI